MDDQRGWQERYGVDDWEVHHWVAVLAIASVCASPFIAIVRGEAGLLFFAAGVLAFFLAAHAAPDKNQK